MGQKDSREKVRCMRGDLGSVAADLQVKTVMEGFSRRGDGTRDESRAAQSKKRFLLRGPGPLGRQSWRGAGLSRRRPRSRIRPASKARGVAGFPALRRRHYDLHGSRRSYRGSAKLKTISTLRSPVSIANSMASVV